MWADGFNQIAITSGARSHCDCSTKCATCSISTRSFLQVAHTPSLHWQERAPLGNKIKGRFRLSTSHMQVCGKTGVIFYRLVEMLVDYFLIMFDVF